MSILIKDVAMVSTASCAGCDFCGGYIMPDGIYCCDCPSEISHGRNITENIEKDNKPDWCPIVELPYPHGDLIDIDSKITIGIKDGLKVTTVRDLLNDKAVRLPKTVIEAEDGDTE